MKLSQNSHLYQALDEVSNLFEKENFDIDILERIEKYLILDTFFKLNYCQSYISGIASINIQWTKKITVDSFIDNMISLCESVENLQMIEDNFYQITPSGLEENGILALIKWASERKMDIPKTIQKYIEDYNSYEKYRNTNSLIDATNKQKDGFLDKMYYCDFYTHGNFGKTKLGSWTFYGK